MIEIGFRSDYDPEGAKVAEKRAQHAPMAAALAAWYEVDYQVWDIGHTGMLPNTLKLQAERLGVADPAKLCKELHNIAVEHALLIVNDRRLQERTHPHTTPPNGRGRHNTHGRPSTSRPPTHASHGYG